MYTQTERAFRFDTCLGADKVLLQSFEGTEAISSLFRFVVRFLSDTHVDIAGMLGTKANLAVQSEFAEMPVYLHGRIWSLRQRADSVEGLFAYEAELVPSLQLLTLYRSCRIFHRASVKTIVANVLDSHGLKNYRFDLQSALSAREYCVQYQETDLDFLTRLLEEEGIFYYFEHTADQDELVLSDRKTGLPQCPAGAEAQYHPVAGGLGAANPVFTFEVRQQMTPGGVETADYNFETPKVSLTATLDGNPNGVLYEYPGWYGTKPDGERYVRIRLEEEEARIAEMSGTSSCVGFRAGHSFQLNDHVYRDWNKPYLLTSVRHQGRNESYRGEARSSAARYENSFRAIPWGVQYRPRRKTIRPIVHGTQTAVVTGPKGQEIYTDRYGRVQVRFFWADADSLSCWVRVAQTWAGKNWGSVAIPRVGQEVVVDFLEGNPDRPLIIGSVYNADQMPPYELPANKTRSGVRSHSSEGGSVSNCNEIYLEDRMGEEIFFLQAERDHEIRVKHDRKADVTNDDTLQVGHNRSVQISVNDSVSVGGDRSASVGKNDTVTIGAKLEITAGEEIKLTAPGGSITIGAAGISIESPMTITVRGALVQIN